MKTILTLTVLFVLAGPAMVSEARAQHEIWSEIDIVPMPKEISLTGEKPALSPSRFALVLGDRPSRQSQRGAEWINKRLQKLGGAPLPILKNGETADPQVRQIVIGSKDDNARVAGAVEKGLVKVGDKDPGVRGYEMRFDADGTVYLAGADDIGVLYACVTLGELLEKQGEEILLREANVRDWPDIQYLYVLDMEPPSNVKKDPDSPQVRQIYLDRLAHMYEGMLRRKLSMVWYKPLMWGDTAFRDMSPYARETVRLGIEAGKELGIEALYYHLSPFVGLRSDHPNVDPDLLEQKPKARYDKWLQSWSMDDERRVYARELAAWVKEVGFTDVGFHDTDTGGYLNPANWNHRGPVDQKRWGDDYTAATIHKFRIFFDALMEANPKIRVNLTLYPYNSEIFDPSEAAKADLKRILNIDAEKLEYYRKRYVTFWTQLNAAFPKKDVSFAIREPWSADGGPGLKAFLSLIEGRPLFAWYGLAAAEFYSNVPSWLRTLHSGSVDDIVFTQNIYVDRGFVPILSYAMREYSWNTRAPGAATFQTRDRARMRESAAGDNTTLSYTVVLPHLVRNYFGRELAPEITKAISLNVSPFIVLGGRPDRNIIDETEGRMKWEAENAAVAAQAMDVAWDRLGGANNVLGLETDVFARVAYLRQVFHATQLTAGVKEAIYRSQRLSSLNQYEEAAAAVEQGRVLLETGIQHLTALEAESPPAASPVAGSARSTLDKVVPVLQGLLAQRTEVVATNRRSGGIPAKVLELLAEETNLPVTKTDRAPVVDGVLTDEAWQKSYPTEAWFLVGPERLVADVETQFRAVSDEENLYVAFRCQVGANTEVGMEDADREFVRVYIKRDVKGEKNLFAVAVWANGKVETTDRSVPFTSRVTVEKGQWQGELQIPLKALGSLENCRMGLLRGYSRVGFSNMSATVPLDASIGGSFEEARTQLEKFPQAKPVEDGFQASARIRIANPKVREVTLDDRIATMVDFEISAESDCVLDNVVIEAEAVTPDGQVEGRKQILGESSMKYRLRPSEPFSVTFLQAVDKGAVRVRLKSDQATAEASYQFGK